MLLLDVPGFGALRVLAADGQAAANAALAAADVVTGDVVSALDLLRHPARLVATLRD